ncbi:AMP-binding protein [Halopseudomonas bauzanensis]|uniref:AMP-binding protein n=1 Tax=Halopseudomonas bauzanensis TaxID=653930 RepID=UPI003523D2D9
MTAELFFAGSRLSPDQVEQRGWQLSGGLARLGVEEGDVIALMLRNSVPFVDAIQAGQIAGCYYCPINWHFKADEVGYILRDSGAKVLLIEADLLEQVREAIPPQVVVLVVGAEPGALQGRERDYPSWLAEQVAYDGPPRTARMQMAYTSGTTGRPKGVKRLPPAPGEAELARQRMGEMVEAAWGIRPGVRALVSAPLYHSAPGSFTQQALQQAETLVLMPRFDAEQTLELIQQHRIDTLFLVPIMFVRLLRLPEQVRARYDLSSVRFVASTGAPCAPEVKQAMLDWWGPVIHETYASSETGMVTIQDPESARRKPGSVGRPIGDTRIRIIGADGGECATGEPGVIYVRQPAVTDFTYANNPQARARAGLDDLVSVGDIGYLDADGYLFVCDRASDMVISGGVNIYPAEIEHVLIGMPGVVDCAVFGVPDAEYGEALVAVVASSDPQLDAEAVRAHVRQRMAGYKTPREVRFVEQLPRDDNGKVAKRRLQDSYIAETVQS